MSSASTSPAAVGPSANAAANGSSTQNVSPSPPAAGVNPNQLPHDGIHMQSAQASYDFIDGDPLCSVVYVDDPAWPTELCLDRSLGNWNEWSHRLKLVCMGQSLAEWLDVTYNPPDPDVDPRAHRVWTLNDQSLSAFMLLHVSQEDYKAVCDLPDSRTIFAELRKLHEKLGNHTQILLIEKAMKIRFRPGMPPTQTWDEIDTIMEKIKAIGPIDYDQLKTAFAIHALTDHYGSLQSTVQSITKRDNFTVSDVANRIFDLVYGSTRKGSTVCYYMAPKSKKAS